MCNSLDFFQFHCREFMQLAERRDFSRSAACRSSIINKLFTVGVGLSVEHRFSGAAPAIKFCAHRIHFAKIFFGLRPEQRDYRLLLITDY
jgi:hypothetical protein